MKPLKDLNATYASKDISSLVDFTRQVPLELPENRRYHFEKDGSTVHIYGVDAQIKKYGIGDMGKEMSLKGILTTDRGVEIGLNYGDVEKIILHSEVFEGELPSGRTSYITNSIGGESRSSSESRRRSSGESRSRGESRKEKRRSGESRTQRESHYSGESRGGESR